MSLKKCKLVLKAENIIEPVTNQVIAGFRIVKSINTLEFGIPGEELSREAVDKILKKEAQNIRNGKTIVEFI